MKKIFDNKKELVLSICVIVGVIGIIVTCILFMKNDPIENPTTTTKKINLDNTETIAVTPTMYDTLLTDSSWCPTFELIWGDLKNKYVHQDIKWDGAPSIVDSLNKEYFKEDMISDSYLFKVSDYKTLALRDKIKKGIKDKFNQESDIIDELDWSPEALDQGPNASVRKILLYSMLYREFEYNNPLDELKNSTFKDVQDVRYFGINEESESKLRDQIDVLDYDGKNYTIRINTKNNDELYLVFNPDGKTFNEIWENAKTRWNNYNGNKSFGKEDYLKIPYLSFDIIREYTELYNHVFYDTEGYEYIIQKALQTIKLELDNKGGKVKSEAVLETSKSNSYNPATEETRLFNYNDTFALFIKEKDKDVPYFAARIDDINKYQQEA